MATFHWFLPTGGDGRHLGGQVHGTAIGGAGDEAPATGERGASLEYLVQLARAVDMLGYEGVLTPTGSHCEDAWIVTAALINETRRLKFLVAFRPGLVAPMLAAQMATSFQRLSAGRVLLNVVAGGSDAEQRSFGDRLGHDERYDRAGEFLSIVRRAFEGETIDFSGRYYSVESGRLQHPPLPSPSIYFGGSSDSAAGVAARHADVYLTWGEPPEQVDGKLAWMRELAKREGRTLRFGIRLHVVTRDDSHRAWRDADALISGLDDGAIAARQARLSALESVGQRRMLSLHNGSREHLVVAPNLWAGIGLVRGGAGTALVGSHEEVAERILEYERLGIDEFIMSGYPHLEEAFEFAEGVLPLVGAAHGGNRGAGATRPGTEVPSID